MPRHDPNLARLEVVAARLGPLWERVMFLGGAVVGLLVTDEAAPEIRATQDVDCVVEVASKVKFMILDRELQALGFTSDSEPGAPMCRYVVDDLKVDIMPTDPRILGFANRWASEAMQFAVEHRLSSGLVIKHVNAPYFWATKLEAFRGRGGGDFLFSHDVEDIVTVVDGRPTLVAEVVASKSVGLRGFLREECRGWESSLEDVVQAHLPPDAASQARASLVLSRIREIARIRV